MTKIKPFINRYNWEGIILLSRKDGQKEFEENSLTVSLNVSYAKK